MDIHFDTPSRLERQIAQDLMQDHSELDLSIPGYGNQNQTPSISRHPFSNLGNNQTSYSRASVSSDSFHEQSFDISNNGPKSKQPLSLAAAVANAQQRPQRPGSAQSSSTSSSAKPREKHGFAPQISQDQENQRPTYSASSSVSVDQGLTNSQARQFPDPYAHLRAVSPPLTSTPQRPGPASTVGSRSRTATTIRPGQAGGNTSNTRATMLDGTFGSTTRGARSARSGSSLEDLTQSSIAPEEEEEAPMAPPAGRDFFVYDTQTTADTEGDVAQTNSDAQTGTMHTSDFEPREASLPQDDDSRSNRSTNRSGTDWKRRRAERRQIIEENEESMIDDDYVNATRQAEQVTETMQSQAEQETDRLTSNYDVSHQTGAEAETEKSGTTFSSPAAARLARQSDLVQSRRAPQSTPRREAAEAQVETPAQTAYSGGDTDKFHSASATPTSRTTAADQEKMKAYLLNSVKATATVGGRRSDALERLRARSRLSNTPGGGDHIDASSFAVGINTPKARADRLGKANTIAAGRTPLPKGGIAELLRRGALSRLGDSGSSRNSPASFINRSADGVDHQTVLESLSGISETSSNDLTAPPHTSMHGPLGLRANTSFPGLGAAEVGTDANSAARPRVDPARLALYQSKLNARLDAENEELKKERDELARQLEEMKDQLNKQKDSSTSAEKQRGDNDEELQAERERANALDREAQELADLLEEREREIEALKADIDQIQQEHKDGPNDNATIDLKFELEELQAILKEKDEDIFDLEDRLESERKQMEDQVQQAKAYSFETLEKVEAKRDEALEKVTQLKVQLEESRSECDRLNAELDSRQAREKNSAESENIELKQRVSGLERRNQQLQAEAEAAAVQLDDEKIRVAELEKQVDGWRREVEDLENDLQDERQRAEEAEARLAQDSDVTPRGSDHSRSTRSSSALEKELQQAHKKIKELTSRLASDNLKDMEIDTLKTQKAELENRVDEYRKMLSASEHATPRAQGLAVPPTTPDGSSPLPKSVMGLRHLTPVRTPGFPGELSSASWLYNESSLGAGGVAERIAFLEAALDKANASIDAKLQKLDNAGVAHLTLAERLQQAHDRIAELEAELERLRLLAPGAGTFSSSISRSPNKSTAQRQRVFADVHMQLEALKSRWAGDHDKLMEREKAVEERERHLGDKSREYKTVLSELDRFREAAASLQEDLQAEQAKQRSMLAKSKVATQEKAEIEMRLQKTQRELDSIKTKLSEKMGGLEDLSRQLRRSTHGKSLQRQVDTLSSQVGEAESQISTLKSERLSLLSQRSDLHTKYSSVVERYEAVFADLQLSRQTLSAHQAQLDEQIEQMEKIHKALQAKKVDYDRVVGDRDRLRADRDEIVRDVGKFEEELRRVRREADRQGQDLQVLRAEREASRRMDETRMVQLQTLVNHLQAKTLQLERVPSDLHAEECRGLMLQIRYLKLKLGREADLRADLAHQKTYISLLLKGLVSSDTELGRLLLDLRIARPQVEISKPRMRWMSAIAAVRAMVRINMMAKKWNQATKIKETIRKASEEMRTRRGSVKRKDL